MRRLWDELTADRVFQPATVADAFVGFVNGISAHAVGAATNTMRYA